MLKLLLLLSVVVAAAGECFITPTIDGGAAIQCSGTPTAKRYGALLIVNPDGSLTIVPRRTSAVVRRADLICYDPPLADGADPATATVVPCTGDSTAVLVYAYLDAVDSDWITRPLLVVQR